MCSWIFSSIKHVNKILNLMHWSTSFVWAHLHKDLQCQSEKKILLQLFLSSLNIYSTDCSANLLNTLCKIYKMFYLMICGLMILSHWIFIIILSFHLMWDWSGLLSSWSVLLNTLSKILNLPFLLMLPNVILTALLLHCWCTVAHPRVTISVVRRRNGCHLTILVCLHSLTTTSTHYAAHRHKSSIPFLYSALH